MIRDNYNTQEWTEKEKYYEKTLMSITMPEMPETNDVKRINSKVDTIATEAQFEYAYLRRKEARLQLELKNEEAALFVSLKKQQLTAGNKITENDVKGLVKEFLMTNPINGYPKDIYTMIKAVMDRLLFMESVIKIIKDKREAITAANISLNIEVKASGSTKGVELERVV